MDEMNKRIIAVPVEQFPSAILELPLRKSAPDARIKFQPIINEGKRFRIEFRWMALLMRLIDVEADLSIERIDRLLHLVHIRRHRLGWQRLIAAHAVRRDCASRDCEEDGDACAA